MKLQVIIMLAVLVILTQQAPSTDAKTIAMSGSIIPAWGDIVKEWWVVWISPNRVRQYWNALQLRDQAAYEELYTSEADKKIAKAKIQAFYDEARECLNRESLVRFGPLTYGPAMKRVATCLSSKSPPPTFTVADAISTPTLPTIHVKFTDDTTADIQGDVPETITPATPEPTTVTPVVTPTPYVEPVTSAPYVEPVTSAPNVEPVTSTPYVEPVTSAPNVEPVTSTPYVESETSTPYVEPVTSTPCVEPVTSAPNVEPVTSTPCVEPVMSTPYVEPATSTPYVEPVMSTPDIEPMTSTPYVEPVMSTPDSKTMTSVPYDEPVATETVTSVPIQYEEPIIVGGPDSLPPQDLPQDAPLNYGEPSQAPIYVTITEAPEVQTPTEIEVTEPLYNQEPIQSSFSPTETKQPEPVVPAEIEIAEPLYKPEPILPPAPVIVDEGAHPEPDTPVQIDIPQYESVVPTDEPVITDELKKPEQPEPAQYIEPQVIPPYEETSTPETAAPGPDIPVVVAYEGTNDASTNPPPAQEGAVVQYIDGALETTSPLAYDVFVDRTKEPLPLTYTGDAPNDLSILITEPPTKDASDVVAPPPDSYPFSPASKNVPPLWALDVDRDGKVNSDEWLTYVTRLHSIAENRVVKGQSPTSKKLLAKIVDYHYAMLNACIQKELEITGFPVLNSQAYDHFSKSIEQGCYVKFRYSLFAGAPPFQWIAKKEPTVTASQIEKWFNQRVATAKHDMAFKRVLPLEPEQQKFMVKIISCVYNSLQSMGGASMNKATYYKELNNIEQCAHST